MACEPAQDLRRWARGILQAAGTASPGLDARLLLQHTAGLTHEMIAAEPLIPVPAAAYRAAVKRRAAGEPVSRITGGREFYGRRFALTPAVLDPRPDTEVVIEAALALPWQTVLDLGTGSGAIAVTLLAERRGARATATDISPEALAVAAANAAAHGVADRLSLHLADWFAGVAGRFDLIVSNPPYIPSHDVAALAREVRDHDPLAALAGGEDGLSAYRQIAAGAAAHLASGGHIAVEIGAGQESSAGVIFRESRFRPATVHRDLAGHVRVLVFRPPAPDLQKI